MTLPSNEKINLKKFVTIKGCEKHVQRTGILKIENMRKQFE